MRTKTLSQAEKILKVAARLFATHRFHEARMEDIAAAAEVGKGTLYRYFKDKDELYQALLARAAEQLTARLYELEELEGTPRTRLEAVVDALLSYFIENPHLFDLIQHAEVMQRPNTEFPWARTRQRTKALVEQCLEDGKRAGAFAVPDPHLSALLILGGIRAVIRFDDRPRTPDLAARIVDVFVGPARPSRASRLG